MRRMARSRMVGQITRGTTGTNRLRRVDRWIARLPELRRAADPLVVDLGFGASAVTALELEARLRRTRPDVEILGLEIDPARVARAREQLGDVRTGSTSFAADARVSFALGGFEVPAPGERRPAIIRAFNVLRQYDESEVADAWRRMTARLGPDGLLVEGTCDEIGRIATWAAVGPDAVPRTLTISMRVGAPTTGVRTDRTEPWRPSIAAERLPKALIHRNVPGEGIHALLQALDAEWDRAAGMAPFGPVQRWRATLDAAAAAGWPLQARSRWRLGEVTVPWDAVAPAT
jgi:hypothetical protein